MKLKSKGLKRNHLHQIKVKNLRKGLSYGILIGGLITNLIYFILL